MKKVSLFLVFLAVLSTCNVTPEIALASASYETSTIRAADNGKADSSQPLGKVQSPGIHNNAAAELSTSNSISAFSTVSDSKEDPFQGTLVEEFTQRRAAVLLAVSNAIEIGLSTRILIFPFHFFL